MLLRWRCLCKSRGPSYSHTTIATIKYDEGVAFVADSQYSIGLAKGKNPAKILPLGEGVAIGGSRQAQAAIMQKNTLETRADCFQMTGVKVALEDAERIAKGAVFNAIENDKSSGFEVRSYLASLQCSLVVGEQVRQETEIESSSLATEKIWDTCYSASNDRDPDIELDLESGVDQCIVVR